MLGHPDSSFSLADKDRTGEFYSMPQYENGRQRREGSKEIISIGSQL